MRFTSDVFARAMICAALALNGSAQQADSRLNFRSQNINHH